MGRKIRLFLYSQHLSGTGHFVRTYEIARVLAEHHDVYMLQGGRPVPRSKAESPISTLNLPPIYRKKDGITPVDSTRKINDVMEERRNILHEFIRTKKPDVILIEHFPFSKQLLAPEILPFIQLAKEVNPEVRVVCSLRDIIPRSPRDPDPDKHRENVLKYLKDHFDAILVHSDPQLVRLEDHVPWISEISVPVEYTGYVSEKSVNTKVDDKKAVNNTVVVSAGGAGSLEIIKNCINAWKHTGFIEVTRNRVLIVFLPLFLKEGDYQQLKQLAGGNTNIRLMPFTPEFIQYLKFADISISQAGYNTCTNILEARIRSILVPDIKMSDQLPRGELMSKLGMATMIHPDNLSVDKLMKTITRVLEAPKPEHNINLDGAHNTSEVLGGIC